MATYTSNTVSLYYSASDITDLTAASPVYKYTYLSWTSNPGDSYYLYYLVGGTWTYSGINVSGNTLQVEVPSDVYTVQLRTNNVEASNVVDLDKVNTPETRVITATPRYDGVQIDWTPNTLGSEKVWVYRNDVLVYNGAASFYIGDSGTYKIRMYKGSGSDLVVGEYSNTVTETALTPPPARVEPSSPAEFYLGNTRAGSGVMHICSPSVVPSSVTVESGKVAVDWFQDYVGVEHDYGSDTYFHSNFNYVYCTAAYRINTYTDTTSQLSGAHRRFYFADALDYLTGTGATFNPGSSLFLTVLVTSNGDRIGCAPVLTRRIETGAAGNKHDSYSLGLFGFDEASAYYFSSSYVRTDQNISSVEFFVLNISTSGRTLVYNSQTGTDNGIIMNPNDLEVRGNNFGGMMLSYCGEGADGYVDSMNLNDALVPMRGSVDSAGRYIGSTVAVMQILGSAGGTGWYVDMETGLIKRGDNIWFNAGRGRTRMCYTGLSYANQGVNYSTPSFTVSIPEHSLNGGAIPSSNYSTSFTSSQGFLLEGLHDATLLGVAITPTSYTADDVQWTETYTEDRTSVAFDTFAGDVPIHRISRDIQYGVSYDSNGDPYYEVSYSLECTVYLRKVGAQFYLIVDYDYAALYNSAGVARDFTIPGFSYSFIGLS